MGASIGGADVEEYLYSVHLMLKKIKELVINRQIRMHIKVDEWREKKGGIVEERGGMVEERGGMVEERGEW